MKKILGRLVKDKPATGVEQDKNANEQLIVPDSVEKGLVADVPAQGRLKRFIANRKKWQLALMGLGLVAVLILAIPASRYPALGMAVKKQASIKVLDQKSGLPVSEAAVRLGSETKTTNSDGIAQFDGVKLGKVSFEITKNLYDTKTINGFVGLSAYKIPEATLTSQGRSLSFRTINKITKQPVGNIAIEVLDSKALSDGEGKVSLVVPLDVTEIKLKLTGSGFVEGLRSFKVTELENRSSDVGITPEGTIYLLSKQSGKIDVVKTNLDGTERTVVLKGTGYEKDEDTILLASRDWRYLALKAKRDAKKDFQAIYLINTADDSLTTIDEGNATFTLNGWAGKSLIFTVDRKEIEYAKPDKHRLKSFNADSKKLTTLDRSSAKSYGPGSDIYDYYENRTTSDYFRFVSVSDDRLLYIKEANFEGACNKAVNGIYLINPDGTNKVTVLEKNFSDVSINGWESFTYKPNEIYYSTDSGNCASSNSDRKFYEYEFGGSPKEMNEAEWRREERAYKAFVVSPDAQNVLWSESRDGKNVFFLGDLHMENEKEVARLEDFGAYGWYGNEYLLISRRESELYIMARDGGEPVKISDYHKPEYDYRGYGYGYGGH